MYFSGEISPTTPRFQGQQQPDRFARLEALIENLGKRYEDAEGMFRNQQASIYNNERPPQNQSDPLARLEGVVEKFVSQFTKRFEVIDSVRRDQQSSIHNIEKQVGQIAQVLQERIPGNLPGFTKTNPNVQVNAISTSSESTFSQPRLVNDQNFGAKMDQKEQKNEEKEEYLISSTPRAPIRTPRVERENFSDTPCVISGRPAQISGRPASTVIISDEFLATDGRPASPFGRPAQSDQRPASENDALRPSVQKNKNSNSDSVFAPYKPPIPFPNRLRQSKEEADYQEHVEHIKSIKINVPFKKAIKKMPKFGEILRSLLTNRKEMEDVSVVELNKKSSAFILPEKMKDPGSLTLPCRFGNSLLTNGLADSGASINVMPYSFYTRLKLPELKPTRMAIHLANKSVTHPRGIVEDILVRVDKFVIPTDFVIIDMKEDKKVPILLGRPFLATAGTLIDVRESKLTLRVGDESISYEMDKSTNTSNPSDNSVFYIDAVDLVLQDTINGNVEDKEKLEKVLEEEIEEQTQNEEHTPMTMQHEQIFRIDAKVENVFFIDESDETLEEEWKNSQAKKDEDEGRLDLFKDTIDTKEELRRIEELLGYSFEEEAKGEECDLQVTSDLTPHTHLQGANAVQDHKIQNSKEDNLEGVKKEKSIQVTNPLKGNKKEMKDLVEEPKLKCGVVCHPKTNKTFPSVIPPKPPEHPFALIPKPTHSRDIATHSNKNSTHVTWEQTKKGRMGVEKTKPQANMGYESRRDKWKEDIHGARGEKVEGVMASPDANFPT